MPLPNSNLKGKVLKFDNPDDLQARIDAYFEHCDDSFIPVVMNQITKDGLTVVKQVPTPPTCEGLCEWLGTNKVTLLDYENLKHDDHIYREDFADIIATAKQKITRIKVERALIGAYDSRFAIFDLVNNSGYRNEKAVDHTSGGERITSVTVV